jgi:ribosome-binding factor A
MNHRPERVASLIREELSLLIVRELEFPDTLVTLTDVEVNKKLELAKVGVTVFPSEKADETMAVLKRSQGQLQRLLNHKLNIRPMPRIDFFPDHGPENAARVEKKLLDHPAPEDEGAN